MVIARLLVGFFGAGSILRALVGAPHWKDRAGELRDDLRGWAKWARSAASFLNGDRGRWVLFDVGLGLLGIATFGIVRAILLGLSAVVAVGIALVAVRSHRGDSPADSHIETAGPPSADVGPPHLGYIEPQAEPGFKNWETGCSIREEEDGPRADLWVKSTDASTFDTAAVRCVVQDDDGNIYTKHPSAPSGDGSRDMRGRHEATYPDEFYQAPSPKREKPYSVRWLEGRTLIRAGAFVIPESVGTQSPATPGVTVSSTLSEALDNPKLGQMATQTADSALAFLSTRRVSRPAEEAAGGFAGATLARIRREHDAATVGEFERVYGPEIGRLVGLLAQAGYGDQVLSDLYEAVDSPAKANTVAKRLKALGQQASPPPDPEPESEAAESLPIGAEPGPWLRPSEAKTEYEFTFRQNGEAIDLSLRPIPQLDFGAVLRCDVEEPGRQVTGVNALDWRSTAISALVQYPFEDSPSLTDGLYIVWWRSTGGLFKIQALMGGGPIRQGTFQIKEGRLVVP